MKTSFQNKPVGNLFINEKRIEIAHQTNKSVYFFKRYQPPIIIIILFLKKK